MASVVEPGRRGIYEHHGPGGHRCTLDEFGTAADEFKELHAG